LADEIEQEAASMITTASRAIQWLATNARAAFSISRLSAVLYAARRNRS
jgi:hypothetical protein